MCIVCCVCGAGFLEVIEIINFNAPHTMNTSPRYKNSLNAAPTFQEINVTTRPIPIQTIAGIFAIYFFLISITLNSMAPLSNRMAVASFTSCANIS